MQRENEISRVVLEGRRTDDGALCTVIAIREPGRTWAFYPHGAGKFGIRLRATDAAALVQAMLERSAGNDHC